MNDKTEALSEREGIEALLPWYVTGKLDAAGRAQVDAYLARHPGMRRQLALVEEDRDVVQRVNAAIVPPRTLSADRLLERARGPARAAGAKSAWATALEAARDFFSAPTATGMRWAAAAAVVVMLAQAAVIGGLMRDRPQDRPGGGYETASGGAGQTAEGARVLVRFQPGATIEAMTAALEKQGMRIVDGPKPGQLFVVRIGEAAMSDAEKTARIAKLQQMTALVAVVLPMGR